MLEFLRINNNLLCFRKSIEFYRRKIGGRDSNTSLYLFKMQIHLKCFIKWMLRKPIRNLNHSRNSIFVQNVVNFFSVVANFLIKFQLFALHDMVMQVRSVLRNHGILYFVNGFHCHKRAFAKHIHTYTPIFLHYSFVKQIMLAFFAIDFLIQFKVCFGHFVAVTLADP